MRNFHQNRRVVAYCSDILRSQDLSTEQAVTQILLVADLLALIRGVDGHEPVARNQISRHLGIPSRQIDALIEPMLPVDQQRRMPDPPITYNLIKRTFTDPGAQGRPAEYYSLIRMGRPPKTAPLPGTWDGQVIDAGYRESLEWDIAIEMHGKKWLRESRLIELFKGYRTVDDSGVYGVHGVRAHIEDMIEWGRLRRASTEEARELIGLKSTGRVPAIILLGDAPLNPKVRMRARRYNAEEHLRSLKVRTNDQPLEATQARRKSARTGRPPEADLETASEPAKKRNAPKKTAADPKPAPAETPKSGPQATKPDQDVPDPTSERPASLETTQWAEGEWPDDEPVPGEDNDEGISDLASARARRERNRS